MKAKANTVLIVVGLLLYWIGLCNASAFYDPLMQRWINRDPLGEPGFEVLRRHRQSIVGDGPNRYFFVENDPITSIDSDGTQLKWIIKRVVPRLFPKDELGGPYRQHSCKLTGSYTTCAEMGPNAKICYYTCIPGGYSDEISSLPVQVTSTVGVGESCPVEPPNAPHDPPR